MAEEHSLSPRAAAVPFFLSATRVPTSGSETRTYSPAATRLSIKTLHSNRLGQINYGLQSVIIARGTASFLS
jgi:hypothetical protein